MAFGQRPGPPATTRQVRELLELLQEAGHADFRDARGPMGFSQRQAAGHFTRDEADALIERLLDAQHEEHEAGSSTVPARRPSAAEPSLRHLPAERLAAELQRRGWVVLEP
jgi:hypothetical protein